MPARRSVWLYLCYALACVGLGVYIYSRIPGITNFPFAISWSESGRIFNAYQIYAPLISGKHLSWPWLDPGRSILDGLVLLLPSTQIWMERFWIDFLFFLSAIAVSAVTIKKAFASSPLRHEKGKSGLKWLLIIWGMFFLLQGPVYYHVLLGVIAILWLYDAKKPLLTLALVIIGSIWEGLCRVNWFLMPACLAILLHLLQEPFSGKKLWQYLRWPLVYLVAGAFASFTTYFIFIKTTGYTIPFLNPKMDYAFFLYKLWPNDGFIGLIPGIALICLPSLAIILYAVWKHKQHLHWLRLLAIASILAVFFAGSTLVSLRAGGGYDWHNYDSFLLLLFVCCCFFGLEAISLDKPALLEKVPLGRYAIIFCLLLVSALFVYRPIQSVSSGKFAQSAEAIQQINTFIDQYRQTEHPVLFIEGRQLLVYRKIPDVQIFVPYDKIELMEMAMARNSEYGNKFSADIRNQRFSLIVSEVLQKWQKHFDPQNIERDWYESNVWVDMVSTPILTYYEPVYVNQDLGIAIYVPK